MKMINGSIIISVLFALSAQAADVESPVYGEDEVKAQADKYLVDTVLPESTMITTKKVTVKGGLFSKVGQVPAEDVTRVFTIGDRSNALLTFGDVDKVSKDLEARWYHCGKVVTAYPYRVKPAHDPHHVWFWINTKELGLGPAAVDVRERDTGKVLAKTDFDVRDEKGNTASCGMPKRISLSADALFAFGRSSLSDVTPKGQQELHDVVSQLNTAYSKINQIVVTGHTDSIGSEAANMALSQARANSIRQYFVNNGIPAATVSAQGRGETETLTNCNEALPRAQLIQCKQPDRRVTINIDGVQRDLK